MGELAIAQPGRHQVDGGGQGEPERPGGPGHEAVQRLDGPALPRPHDDEGHAHQQLSYSRHHYGGQ